MNNKKRLLKMILQFLVLTLVVCYSATYIIQSTFASNTDKEPNVIITIDEKGNISQSGSLCGDKQLYPSTEKDAERGIGGISGVIRINNQYKKMDINSIGLGIKEDEMVIGNKYPKDIVYDSFINNVKIKIEKGVLFVFDKTLIDYTSLKNLIYRSDSEEYKGFIFDKGNKISLGKGDTIDLKYTLHMIEVVGNELELVSVNIPIYVNIHGSTIIDNKEKDKKVVKPRSHWAHNCIISLLDHEIIQGYPHESMSMDDYRNGKVDPIVYVNEAVQPEKYITRAEAAMLVGKALGLEEEQAFFSGYIDNIPTWARGYIIATTKEDVFEGYPFKMFKANKHITREEMIAVLIRAFKADQENEEIELVFEDKDEIAEWAREYVEVGVKEKIIVGYPDNTYKPKNDITRAEAFTIICKLLGYHAEHNI